MFVHIALGSGSELYLPKVCDPTIALPKSKSESMKGSSNSNLRSGISHILNYGDKSFRIALGSDSHSLEVTPK